MLVKVLIINDQYLSFDRFIDWEDPLNSNMNIKKKTEEAEKHGFINFLYLLKFGHLEIQNLST